MYRNRPRRPQFGSLIHVIALSAATAALPDSASAQLAPLNVRIVASGTGGGTAPSAPPAVEIAPGQNIQSVINSHPAGTRFLLKAGIHRHQTITPRTGDTFVGETSGGSRLTILSGARVLTGWV